MLGDGEEVVGEITEAVSDWIGADSGDREGLLRALCRIDGVYVPAAYEVGFRHLSAGPDAVVASVEPRWSEAPATVPKRTLADLAEWPYPRSQMVPLTEVVHDRLNVEVFRGCTRGCRFCQAGMITRPVRERPAEQVSAMVREGLARTGYDEVALTSLSSADFSGIADTVADIVDSDTEGGSRCRSSLGRRLAWTSPPRSRTGLTFAPEAGTWRMRQVINKLIRGGPLRAVDSVYCRAGDE
ncbi:MAG: radical SAM protein [Microthrixaceae bacterium]